MKLANINATDKLFIKWMMRREENISKALVNDYILLQIISDITIHLLTA